MKKLFLAMMAIVALFATSCQKENFGEETTVSFAISTPEIATRAYSDGTTATHLQYAVYDANGNELNDLTVTDGEIHGSTTVKLKLTTGNTYSVIFWAAAPNAPYTVDFGAKTMKVDYTKAACNDEARDAFYAYKTFTVQGTQTEKVELKRPFAQLNIGTNDYEASTKAGFTPTQSAVKVAVYETLNFTDGSIIDETEVTFAAADIDRTQEFPVDNNEYLAMNYLLVAAEKDVVDVEFTYTDKTNAKTRKVGSVPVQRNHRTNIYGSLLTSEVDINVEIKPEYDGIYDYEPILVHNAFDLQKALDAVKEGETTTIWLQADIEGDVIDFQKTDRNVTIDGRGYKYNGTIRIHNGSNYNTGSITIQNVNFETSTSSLNFIMPNNFDDENGVTRRYSQNVTVDGCTFKAINGASKVVGIQAKASQNLKISNCTATDMHSLLQAESCDDDVIVENVETINCQSSVSFNNTKNAKILNSILVSVAEDGYGIRIKGEINGYALTVKDCNVSAAVPVLVRNMTAETYTITFEGTNTLNNTNKEIKPYQVVISKTDYSINNEEVWMDLVKPTGSYELKGADNFNVYPRDVYFEVATWDEFTAALAAGEEKIMLTDNITYEGTNSYNLKKNVEVKLNNKTFTTGNASTTWLNIMGSKATFKNGIIEGKVYVQKNGSTYSDVVFENVTFGGTITFSSVTQGSLAVQGGSSVYAKKCTFKGKGSTTPNVVSLEGTSSGSVIFEDCTFNSSMNRFYANPIGGTAIFKLINCSFNKAAVVETNANWDLNNLTIDGNKKQNVNLYIAKSKDNLTEEEKDILNYIKTKTSGTIYCAGVKY